MVAGTGAATAAASVLIVPRVMTTPGYARAAVQVLAPIGIGLFLRKKKSLAAIGNGLLVGGAASGAYLLATGRIAIPGRSSAPDGAGPEVPPGTLTLPGYTPSSNARTLGLDGPSSSEPQGSTGGVQSTPTIRVGSSGPSSTRPPVTRTSYTQPQRTSGTSRPGTRTTPAPAPAPAPSASSSAPRVPPTYVPPANNRPTGSYNQGVAYVQGMLQQVVRGYRPVQLGVMDQGTHDAIAIVQWTNHQPQTGSITPYVVAFLEAATGNARLRPGEERQPPPRVLGDFLRGEPFIIGG